MPDYDPLTISAEELKQLPPAERAAVYKARAAAARGGAAAPAPQAGVAAAPQAGAAPAPQAGATAAAPQAEATAAAPQAEATAAAPHAEATAAAPQAEATAAAPQAEATAAAPQAEATAAAPQAGVAAAPQAGATAAAPRAGAPPAAARPAPAAKPAPPAEPEKPKEPPFVESLLASIDGSSWQWRHGYAEIKVPREHLLDAARRLRADGFDYLSFITEVDWQDHLELIYHLFAYDFRNQPLGAILRCDLPREGMPAVASVTSVWPGAEFMEREAFEMMGIRFLGHPDLRRILLPDDFVGFPMRRDYETDFDYITVKQLVHESD